MLSLFSIVDYSEMFIAVFGDTKPYRKYLLKLGGLFNNNLTFGDKRTLGWIFPKFKRNEVEELVGKINDGSLEPEVIGEKISNPQSQ